MAHISLTLVGLMWVLPFLYYYHAYPLTTFYQEWGAAVLGLCAAFFILTRQNWVQAEVPRIVLLPLGLLLLVLLQYLLGKIPYFDQPLLFALYMLWVALLMMLGRALREQLGMAVMASALAAFLLAGAELGALAGILQHYRWQTFLDGVITHKNGIAVYGNLAQPNHYANYITLGLISLGLLRAYLRSWQMALLALPLLFVLVLSGSRSTWLYLSGMLVMAIMLQRRDKSFRYLLHYSLLLLFGFGLMHWVVQLPWLHGVSGSVTTMQRMMAGDTSGSIRLYLWHEAWLIFAKFPLLGAGFGQFAWQHFQLGPVLQATNINGLYNNAHNLVMQLAAEMGLAGVLVMFASIGYWLWHGLKERLTQERWWGYAILMVIGIHSMLEYPLWYAYFIGVAAILLGALDSATFRVELRRLGRLSIAAILVMGLLVLMQFQYGYRLLESAINARPDSTADRVKVQRLREDYARVHGMPLLKPYAELFMQGSVQLNAEELDQKLAFNERAAKFIPVGSSVYRRVRLLAIAGRLDEACLEMERAIWAFPGDFPEQKKELAALALKDPKRYSALLEFAIKKNEEYQNAVSAK